MEAQKEMEQNIADGAIVTSAALVISFSSGASITVNGTLSTFSEAINGHDVEIETFVPN